MSLTDAARLVVRLDDETRQHPGDPVPSGSTRAKKARARLNGALLVWEALTGRDVEYAREVVKISDAWREANPGMNFWDDRTLPNDTGPDWHRDSDGVLWQIDPQTGERIRQG